MDKQTLLKELEIENVSPEEQDKMLAEFGKVVIMNVIKKTIEHLSPEDRKTLSEMPEDTSEEAMKDFLNSKIKNYEELSQQAFDETREEIKETIKFLKA